MADVKPIKNEVQVVSYKLSDGTDFSLSLSDVKNVLTKGNGNVTDKEALLFMKICEHQHLNPFLDDAYLIKYSDNAPATAVTSKNAMLKRASNSGLLAGLKSGIFVMTPKGEIVERKGAFHLKNETVVGGWAEVTRKDVDVPFYKSVSYDEYAAKDKRGDINTNWTNRPATMIEKVAIVHALRSAFPENLQGLYTQEEIEKDKPVNSTETANNNQYDIFDETDSEETPVEYTNDTVVGEKLKNEMEQNNNVDFSDVTSTEQTVMFDNQYNEFPDSLIDGETGEIIEDEWQPIGYGEYKDNKDNWIMKPNSYDRNTKTVLVKPKS